MSDADFAAHHAPTRALDEEERASITRFQEFLRIPTVTASVPEGTGAAAVAWLSKEYAALGLETRALEFTPGYPVFVAVWPGARPELPAVLLNSHYDVVPVGDESLWTHAPFAAEETAGGYVVARGAQDMKCVCVQHLDAVRRLKVEGFTPTRTLVVASQPDEEMGGLHGMAKWVRAPEFAALNVGFALDEGIASETDTAIAFNGERTVWWLRLVARGPPGHASQFVPETATAKLIETCQRFFQYRETERAKLGGPHSQGCAHATATLLGDVVTLNLTMLRAGGDALNLIPTEAVAGWDIRVPPHVDLPSFEAELRGMASEGIEFDFVVKSEVNNVTPTDNEYYQVFTDAVAKAGMPVQTQVFPAATDSRYLRNVHGLPVVGFSPIVRQPVLLHCAEERIHTHAYARGIPVFVEAVRALASYVPATAAAEPAKDE